jgi:hypothetical protein
VAYDKPALISILSTALGDDADNVRIDLRNGVAVVGYGSGGLALAAPCGDVVGVYLDGEALEGRCAEKAFRLISLGVRVEIYRAQGPVSLTGAKEGPQSSMYVGVRVLWREKWPTNHLAEMGSSTGVPCCKSGRGWPPLGRRYYAERMPKRSSGRKGIPT